ncbi:MAG: CoA transferase, partial [Dehalococcoidia bacterium]|nr:CoA transferase [Dehalococcoidia bacterium]
MSSALDNIKVLDLSRVPTGSYCTMIMGDLGAEVLKVETPLSAGERQAGQGIPLKGTGTKREIAFNALDRNKKSIALNLKTDEGKKVIFQLVKQFDVFLECFRPGVAGRLGIDYNSLRKLNPKLVYCSLTGWGQDGPRRNFPGHDLNFIAASGALNLIGEKGRKPVIPLNLVADYAGGSLLCV